MKKSWKDTLLGQDKTIKDAAELLTLSSMRIVLVVDDENRLLGTVTDGDIRRAIARGYSMESNVREIMQKEPTTVVQSEERWKIIQKMRAGDLLHLPVLDTDGKVVDLEIVQDFVFSAKRSNPVLLMAGGFGKRLYPLTQDVPKSLLRVGKKPILETILEQLIDAGFSKYFISVHYKSEQVENFFGNGEKWGVSIEYLKEEQPLGTAGALGLLDINSIKQPLLVMNTDLLTGISFGELLEFHTARSGAATICVREYELQIPYGVVQGDDVQVYDIIEKPKKVFFVSAGIYVLDPELILQSRPVQAKDMPELLRTTIRNGKTDCMFPIHENWLDIGRMEEYQRAQSQIQV